MDTYVCTARLAISVTPQWRNVMLRPRALCVFYNAGDANCNVPPGVCSEYNDSHAYLYRQLHLPMPSFKLVAARTDQLGLRRISAKSSAGSYGKCDPFRTFEASWRTPAFQGTISNIGTESIKVDTHFRICFNDYI